jgi:hypothetical protein
LRSGQFVLCVAAASLGWSLCAQAKATYTTFDPPDSFDTYVTGINNGAVTGYYWDGVNHGFVRVADGTITEFDPANSVNTWGNGINSIGAVTG